MGAAFMGGWIPVSKPNVTIQSGFSTVTNTGYAGGNVTIEAGKGDDVLD